MSILHQIPSEVKIRRELKRIIFGKTLFCPHCGSKGISKYGNRYRCRAKHCRKWFSLTSVSWLKNAKLSLQTIWLILWAWQKKISIDQTSKLSGVSRPTISRWYKRFRDNLPKDKLLDIRLNNDIQIDEAYRGRKDKAYSIIGAKQIGTRKIALECLAKNSVDRHEAVDFLTKYVVPGSNLFSDGAAIYQKINNWWPVNHQFEHHNRFEFKLTSEIEGLWGTLVTFIRRMYHHINQDQVPSILSEFSLRFSSPEYFSSPSSYLEISLPKLKTPQTKLWIKFLNKFTPNQIADSSLISKLKLVMPCPTR